MSHLLSSTQGEPSATMLLRQSFIKMTGSSKGMLFRGIYSTILLLFSTVMVVTVILTDNTNLAKDVHPGVAFIILWISIIWLSMVEGGQASLVGLPPVDMALYKESHPTTHKIMSVIKTGDNLDRYLMGRQFMVLALVFAVNLSGEPIEGAEVFGFPDAFIKVFLGSNLALFFMTVMIAKISAQVNASRCMLDYANNFFAEFTMRVAMGIEVSGLLHCCYIVQIYFARLSGQPLESNEPPRNVPQSIFFWSRVVVSTFILAYAFAVTLSALVNSQTTMWDDVPPAVSVILFFVLMAIVGMLEGIQIAFFAIAQLPEAERANHPWAKRTYDILFDGDGRNLPAFMVGRQMCVTMCFFIVARVTTIKIDEDEENIFGVSDGIQALFETGLLGALITTMVASITWQLVASAFPMAFMSTPITYFLMRFCLFLKWTGICQGSWVVARIHRKIVGFKRDEVFIGNAEERAEKAKEEGSVISFHSVKAGHLYPGVPTIPPDFEPKTKTLDECVDVENDIVEHLQDVQNRLASVRAQKGKLLKQKDETVHSVKAGHLYPGVLTIPPDFEPNPKTLDECVDLENDLVEHFQDVQNRLASVRAQKAKLLKENDKTSTATEEPNQSTNQQHP